MTTTVLVELALRPDRLDEAPEIIRQTLVATAEAAGNEGLEVIVDDADPTRVIIVAKWRTTADHDAYAAWRRTSEGAHDLGSIITSPRTKRVFSESIPL
jgi:quinol monooxygenase YgiN